MYLLPSGKEVIVETRDGVSKKINNDKFYKPKPYRSYWETRLDITHGANIYLFMRGNTQLYDEHILSAVLDGDFIDI